MCLTCLKKNNEVPEDIQAPPSPTFSDISTVPVSPANSEKTIIYDNVKDSKLGGDSNIGKEQVPIAMKSQPILGRGNYFPIHLYDNTEPEKVDELPPDIDGMKVYEVHTTPENWKEDTRDRCYFVLSTANK